MVNTNIIGIALIGLVAVVAFIFLLNSGQLGTKTSNTPTIQDILNQKDLPVNTVQSTLGLVGFDPSKVNADGSIDEIKENIISNNLTTENAIRKLNEDKFDVTQVNTITNAGTQTKEVKGIVLAETDTSSLRVLEAFQPAGEGEFLSIRGTPLSKDALVRTEETFSGTLTTTAGGTRDIRGSKALFDRLQSNLNQVR